MSPDYIPAARWGVFSRLYDPVLALAMRERRFRCLMGERVGGDLRDGGTAVDVGCGTGTFAIALSTARPDARVIGVDGDPEILAIALGKEGAEAVEWRDGLAQELPAPEGGADVVTMSLVLHHLLPDDKSRALEEARRVLRPGGRIHIADWGPPGDLPTSAVFYLSQALDGFDRTRDHREGRLPDFITRAGFGPVERYGRFRTAFGALELLTARAEGTTG